MDRSYDDPFVDITLDIWLFCYRGNLDNWHWECNSWCWAGADQTICCFNWSQSSTFIHSTSTKTSLFLITLKYKHQNHWTPINSVFLMFFWHSPNVFSNATPIPLSYISMLIYASLCLFMSLYVSICLSKSFSFHSLVFPIISYASLIHSI